MQEKECTKCHITKPLNEFSKQKIGLFGVRYTCKKCSNISGKDYHHSKLGLISTIYKSQRGSSKRRGDPLPTYTMKHLREWCLSQPLFHELYDKWVDSGFERMKVPSCDRTDDYQGYSLDRLQLMSWNDNYKKSNIDRISGINNKGSKAVIGTHKITGEVIRFYSTKDAFRKTGINHRSISSCCNSIAKSIGGYYWCYEEDYNEWKPPIMLRIFDKDVIGTHIITGKEIRFKSPTEARRVTGICNSSISKCCKGKANQSGGYTWKFA